MIRKIKYICRIIFPNRDNKLRKIENWGQSPGEVTFYSTRGLIPRITPDLARRSQAVLKLAGRSRFLFHLVLFNGLMS